jgi:hypothetical protein
MALPGEKAPVPGVGAALLRGSEGHDQTGHSLAWHVVVPVRGYYRTSGLERLRFNLE